MPNWLLIIQWATRFLQSAITLIYIYHIQTSSEARATSQDETYQQKVKIGLTVVDTEESPEWSEKSRNTETSNSTEDHSPWSLK